MLGCENRPRADDRVGEFVVFRLIKYSAAMRFVERVYVLADEDVG